MDFAIFFEPNVENWPWHTSLLYARADDLLGFDIILENIMKYLALIYAASGAEPQPNTPEFGKLMAGYQAASKVYEDDGVFVAGQALQPVETATSIRIRGGKAELTDGPFAETKEQLGGFYMFECDTLDEAIKYAKMIPTAEYGTVEVRPIMTFD